MGIIGAAMAAAGDAGVQSMNQNIAQMNQQDRDDRLASQEKQRQLDILLAQKQIAIDAANQQREGLVSRINTAMPAVIKPQVDATYGDHDVALAGQTNGRSPLTEEQQAVIQRTAQDVAKSKEAFSGELSADPKNYIKAATLTGDIAPSMVAQMTMQDDTNKRIESEGQLNRDQAKALQSNLLQHQTTMQREQIAAAAKLTKLRLEANASDPALIHSTAQMVADGDATIGLRDPDRAEIMAEAKRINPNYNEGDYKAAYQAKSAFATGKQGEQVRFNNNALEHLSTLQQMALALKNNDKPAYNVAANALAKQFGDPSVTNFDVARRLVGQEVVKAIVPGAGGAKEREEAADAFSRSGSPQQLLGAVGTYTALLNTQIHGLQQQYIASNPVYSSDPSKSDFAKFLTSGTRSITGIKPPAGKPRNWGLAGGDDGSQRTSLDEASDGSRASGVASNGRALTYDPKTGTFH